MLLTMFLFRTGLLYVAGLQLKNKNMSPWPNLTGMTNILLQFIALAQVVSVYMLEGGTVSASSLQMLKEFQMIKNTAWGDRAWGIILK